MQGDRFECNSCMHRWRTKKDYGYPDYCPSCHSGDMVNKSKKSREKREKEEREREREEEEKRKEKEKKNRIIRKIGEKTYLERVRIIEKSELSERSQNYLKRERIIGMIENQSFITKVEKEKKKRKIKRTVIYILIWAIVFFMIWRYLF